MACVPPYCLGTGEWCGCNCKCCPPTPCYDTWTYYYECGTLASEWYWYDGPNQGCDCAPMPFRAPTIPIEFPEFKFEVEEDENGFVFAQAGAPGSDPACIIPCTQYAIVLSTTGCCLYGSGFSFTAVGSGTVSLVPCPSTSCGNFTCSINGSGPSVSVSDCDSITVVIIPPSANCCTCCFIGSSGQEKFTNNFISQRRNVATGLQRTVINKKTLMDRIRKVRVRR